MTARYVLARYILVCALVMTTPVAVSAMASAQTTNTPPYPPGFDCGAVPAGSERESCRQSEMIPNADNNGIIDPANPGSAGGAIQTPGDVSPPTVPNTPGGDSGGGVGGTNAAP